MSKEVMLEKVMLKGDDEPQNYCQPGDLIYIKERGSLCMQTQYLIAQPKCQAPIQAQLIRGGV